MFDVGMIDSDHPDLHDNVVVPFGHSNPANEHATQVAGVFSAAKNDIGMHGIAYEATLLDLTGFDLRDAMTYAAQNGVKVINFSTGYGGIPAGVPEALEIAVGADVIIVVAIGNNGLDGPVNSPEVLVGDPRMRDLMINVAAVNRSGNMPSWSNRCGQTMDLCLVAPGVGIYTTDLGDGYVVENGTSFAAPIVSGAAALLIQLWPNVAAKDIVQILLTTATDLGAPGVDETYGHGLLNLEEAVKPIGQLGVPLSGSAADHGALAINSQMTLGPAFGDALKNMPGFTGAIGVDKFNRAYRINLNRKVQRVKRYFGMDALLAPGETDIRTARLSAGTSLSVGLREADKPGVDDADTPDRDLGSALLFNDIGQQSSISLGYRVASIRQFDLSPGTQGGKGLFWSASDVLSPHHGLLARGNGLALDLALTADTRLTLGWFQESDGALWDAGESHLGQLSLAHRFASGAALRLGASYLTERSLFLGSDATGAFGEESGAESLFVTLSGSLPLSDRIALVGSCHPRDHADRPAITGAAERLDRGEVDRLRRRRGDTRRLHRKPTGSVSWPASRCASTTPAPARGYRPRCAKTIPWSMTTAASGPHRAVARLDFQLAYRTSVLSGRGPLELDHDAPATGPRRQRRAGVRRRGQGGCRVLRPCRRPYRTIGLFDRGVGVVADGGGLFDVAADLRTPDAADLGVGGRALADRGVGVLADDRRLLDGALDGRVADHADIRGRLGTLADRDIGVFADDRGLAHLAADTRVAADVADARTRLRALADGDIGVLADNGRLIDFPLDVDPAATLGVGGSGRQQHKHGGCGGQGRYDLHRTTSWKNGIWSGIRRAAAIQSYRILLQTKWPGKRVNQVSRPENPAILSPP